MSISILIPARYQSSRLQGKPLKKILGKEMNLRVAEKCKKIVNKKNIFILTDDKRIQSLVKKNNYKALMTPKNIKTGTDRVAYAAKKIRSKIFVNVQGDEPLIKPKDIKKIIKAKFKYPNHVICGYADEKKISKVKDKNIIKVIMNKFNELIYFSRSPIPSSKKNNKNIRFKKQICVYAFNNKQLKLFSKSKQSEQEKIEDIELLRFLDLGIKIKLEKISSTIAVDVQKNIKEVENYIRKKK